jgi:hypothetical protein
MLSSLRCGNRVCVRRSQEADGRGNFRPQSERGWRYDLQIIEGRYGPHRPQSALGHRPRINYESYYDYDSTMDKALAGNYLDPQYDKSVVGGLQSVFELRCLVCNLAR